MFPRHESPHEKGVGRSASPANPVRGWHKLQCVWGCGVVPSRALRGISCTKHTWGNLWHLVNSVLLSAPVCLQTCSTMIALLVGEKGWFDFFGLTWIQERRSLELAVAGIGGNNSHSTVSAHIPSQVCVKLNLPHPGLEWSLFDKDLGTFQQVPPASGGIRRKC